MKSGKLIIFGTSLHAHIAFEYFTHDSPYEVAAFTVHREYLKETELFGLPVVAFEDVAAKYPPANFEMHVAMTYNRLNRDRTEVYEEAKSKGYRLANYVSSRAFVWRNVTMGDNVFIFENNTVQPFVTLGSNIILWSGNHIGHHSTIGDHCFISSQVVISGSCAVGTSCFIGVNTTVAHEVTVGKDSLIGAGCLITKSLPDGSYLKGAPTERDAKSTYDKYKLAK